MRIKYTNYKNKANLFKNKMIDKISRKHILPITGLLLFSALIISGAMGQVSTQNSGEYDLNVTTDPVSNVKETEATFQATVDQLDSNFDAALIYWNYSVDSSLNQKGPANVALSQGETVSSLQSGLSPDTAYNVESYAEPVVANDGTLAKNFGRVTADRNSYQSENFVSKVNSNQVVMQAVSNSVPGRTAILTSPYVVNYIWSDSVSSETWFDSYEVQTVAKGSSSGISYVSGPSGSGSALELRVYQDDESEPMVTSRTYEMNLSGKSSLDFKYRVEDDYNTITVYSKIDIDGNEVWSEAQGDTGETQTSWGSRSIDISGYNDVHNVTFIAEKESEWPDIEAQYGDIQLD